MADTTINGLRVPNANNAKLPVKSSGDRGDPASHEEGDILGNTTLNSIEMKVGGVYVSSLGLTLAPKQTGTFTCKPGYLYPVDTTTNEVMGIIPADFPIGGRVTFYDVSGKWNANKFILRSTLKVKGTTDDKEYVGQYQSETLIYSDVDRGLAPINGGGDGGSAGGEGAFEKLKVNTSLLAGGRYICKTELTHTLPVAGSNGESIYYINHAGAGKITGKMVSPEGVNLTELPLGQLEDYSIRFVWDIDLGRWGFTLSTVSLAKPLNIILYDTPGTFTYKPPFGVKALVFIIVGAGGGGGSHGAYHPGFYPSTGGAGGAYCGSVVKAQDVLEEYTITVGLGGKGGARSPTYISGNPGDNGDNGGASSVSGVATANGGQGGRRGSKSPISTRGAVGGIAVGGDISLNGGTSASTSNPYGHYPGGANAPTVDDNLPDGLDGPQTTLIKTTTPVSVVGPGGNMDAGVPEPNVGSAGRYGGGASGGQGRSRGGPGQKGGDGYVIVLEV